MTHKLRRREALAGMVAGLGLPWRVAAASAAASASDYRAGVVTHFIQTSDDIDHALDLIRDAGFTSIRDEVYWGLAERARGQIVIPDRAKDFVDAASRRGITPLLTLDYGNAFWDGGDKPRSPEAIEAFVRYAQAVATTFAGKVQTYEVWNEWHWRMGSTTPGSPDEYVRLFTATRDGLHRADPDAQALADQVVIGDADPSVTSRLAATGFFHDLDGITVHPYFFNRGNERTPEAWAKWMQGADDLLRRYNNGVSVPLYVTEIGWPSHLGRFGVSAPRQAAMAMRLSLLARTLPFVRGLWWYDFRDDGTDPTEAEQNFGLVTNDLKPKPALDALAFVNKMLAGAKFVRSIDSTDPRVHAVSFRLASGSDLTALWLTAEQSCRTVRFRGDPDTFTLLPDAPALTGGDGYVRVAVTEMPVLLRGAFDDVTLIEDVGPRASLGQCRA